MKTHYETLGIDRNATQEQIKLAYRKLSKKHHPDVSGGNQESEKIFLEVQEAYKVLKDPALKETYDARLDGKGTSWQNEQQNEKHSNGHQSTEKKPDFNMNNIEKTLNISLASILKQRRCPQRFIKKRRKIHWIQRIYLNVFLINKLWQKERSVIICMSHFQLMLTVEIHEKNVYKNYRYHYCHNRLLFHFICFCDESGCPFEIRYWDGNSHTRHYIRIA